MLSDVDLTFISYSRNAFWPFFSSFLNSGPNLQFFILFCTPCLLHPRLQPFSLSIKFWYPCLTNLHLSQVVSLSCYYCPLSPLLSILLTRHSDSHHPFIISLLVKITNRKATCSPSCSSNSSHLLFCLLLISFSHLRLFIYFRISQVLTVLWTCAPCQSSLFSTHFLSPPHLNLPKLSFQSQFLLQKFFLLPLR